VLEGTGCGGGPFLPLLGGTRPIVGKTAQLVGEWAPPVPGFLLLSRSRDRRPARAHPARHQALVVPVPIPGGRGFPGLALSFQVIYGPTLGPLGFDLTGGVRGRIGW